MNNPTMIRTTAVFIFGVIFSSLCGVKVSASPLHIPVNKERKSLTRLQQGTTPLMEKRKEAFVMSNLSQLASEDATKFQMNSAAFVENKGQIMDQAGMPVSDVKYLLNGSNLNVQLRTNGFSYDTWVPVYEEAPARQLEGQLANHPLLAQKKQEKEIKEYKFHRVDIQLVNANPNPVIEAHDMLKDKINIIHQTKEIYDIRQFKRIVYKEIYPGIDLEFLAHGNAALPIEYNFIVKPGANASAIALEYKGAEAVTLKNGQINIQLAQGEMQENIPASWLDNKLQDVQVQYKEIGKGVFGFAVPAYDPSKTLTIDPTPRLIWGSFFQEPVNNFFKVTSPRKFGVDDVGNIYIAAFTKTSGLATAGAYQTTTGGLSDLILIKFNNQGQRVASTYYGGTQDDLNAGLHVASDGVYLSGYTTSDGLETTGPNRQGGDLVVVKFGFNLNRIWARYHGGTGTDGSGATVLKTTSSGDLIAVFASASSDLPTAGGGTAATSTAAKFAMAKFKGDGSSVLFSGVLHTPTGSPTIDKYYVEDIEIDGSGNIYLATTLNETSSMAKFGDITTAGSFMPNHASTISNTIFCAALLWKFDASGTRLWSTYVDGSWTGAGNDSDYMALELDSAGNPWVSVSTYSNDFPTTANAYQSTLRPQYFGTFKPQVLTVGVLRLINLAANGSDLLYSSYVYPETTKAEWSAYNDIYIDKATDDIYVGLLYSPNSQEMLDLVQSDCGWYANGSGITNSSMSYFKLTNHASIKEWETLHGGASGAFTEVIYKSGRLHTIEVLNAGNRSDLWENVTTPETYQPVSLNQAGFLIAVFDDGTLPEGLVTSANTLTPLVQTACGNGLSQTIVGNKVSITAPVGYTNTIRYQWQISSDSLAWEDITGANAKNYTPDPAEEGPVYFRRVVYIEGNYCEKVTQSISAVAKMNVRSEDAPVAQAGSPKYFTCFGNAINLTGSASGGAGAPYSYQWIVGSDELPSASVSTFTHTPTETTIYTLKVTDSAGCFGIDQVSVEPVKANAGPDKPLCFGGNGVQIGLDPIQGAAEVNYSWGPGASLSCTACPQPVANPSATTKYGLTVSVLEKSGQVCTRVDTVLITAVGLPNNNPNFAGPDRVVCQGDTTYLGLSAASGFSYTWAPGTYLGQNRQSKTLYDAGTNVVAAPLTYSLTAEKSGCIFVDYADVYTQYFQITPRNLDICYGPVWLQQEADAGEKNSSLATYTWEKTPDSPGGDFEVLATRNNGADAYIKWKAGADPTKCVKVWRKTSLFGKDCYSFRNTICPCQQGGGCTNYTEIRVLGSSGCALVGGNYKLYAKYLPADDFNFEWSPASAFNDQTLAIPTLTSVQNGITVTLKATNKYDPTCIARDTIVVNNPVLTLPVFRARDTIACPNSAVPIGNPPVVGYAYLWDNTAGMEDPDFDKFQAQPSVTLERDITETYIVRVEDIGTGCFVFDTIIVKTSGVEAKAGPDLTVCGGSIVTIGTDRDTAFTFNYNWYPASAPWQNGTNDTDAKPDLLFSSSDSLVMRLEVTDPVFNCIARDTIVLRSPTGGPIPNLLNPDPICPGTSVAIGAEGIQGATYNWSPTTGLSCTTCPNPMAKPETTTTYTVSATGCGPDDVATVTVTVKTAPEFSLNDKETCPSNPVNIGIGAPGNTASLSNVTSYSWSPATGLSCTTCANPTAGPTRSTEYTLVVTYSNGCTRSESCIISPLAGTEANAGSDVTLCPGEEIQLGGSEAAGSSYSWSPSTDLSCTTCANPIAKPSATTTYTLTVSKGGCTASDQVVVSIKALPTFSITGNTSICKGGPGTTIGFNGIVGYTYQWGPTTNVASPTSPSTLVNPTTTTKYTLYQTSKVTGCTNAKSVIVVVNEPEFTLDAEPPVALKICAGSSVTLPLTTLPATGNFVYSWTPSPYLDNSFTQNPEATPSTTTTYTVKVTNLDNNCILAASIPVQVIPINQCTGNDMGDVPYTYEKNDSIAEHKVIPGFKIGMAEDEEIVPASVYWGEDASGDDQVGYDDEDAVTGFQNVIQDADEYAIIVNKVNNDMFTNAYLVSWIDWNRDGCFDADEKSQTAIVPKDETGVQTFELNWNNINPDGILPFGNVYCRVRYTGDISNNWAAYPLPTGYRASGEVEDYNFYIYPSLPFPDSKVTDKDVKVSGDLSANDLMPPGTVYLSPVILGTNPSTDLPMVSADGTFMFMTTTPGVYNFNVPVFDGSKTVNVKLTITVNDPAISVNKPVLGTDNAVTVVDESVVVNTLSNDFGGSVNTYLDPATVMIMTQPLHGTVSVDPLTGNITYTPNAGYVGSDTYMYKVSDTSTPTAMTAAACQFIQVLPENCENTVFAENDQKCAVAGVMNVGNVLDNDMDTEGDDIYVVSQDVNTSDYTFTLNEDGSFKFTTKTVDFTTPVVINYAVYDNNKDIATDTAMLCFYLKNALADFVFLDKNRNGYRDSTEVGIEGVMVTLHECVNGEPGDAVDGYTAKTDMFGFYALPFPPTGTYCLQFDYSGIENADDYKLTIPNIEDNSMDTIDSDANMTTGFTNCIEFDGLTENPAISAGLFPDADNDYIADCFDLNPGLIDPLGYIYCENTGEILDGGLISVAGPGTVYLVFDGSNGYYSFLVDASGVYTVTVTNPDGFATSTACLGEMGNLVTMGDTLNLGSMDLNADDYLDDETCTSNPFYFSFDLTPGALVLNNNYPMTCLDYGDLPATYPTLLTDNGPNHAILQTPLVYLGTIVDMESDGQPETMAGIMGGGDDGLIASADDEDGVLSFPVLIGGEDASFIIQVVNKSLDTAKLVGFIDFNIDGDFADAGEMVTSTVAPGYMGTDTLTFSVPVDTDPTQKFGFRLRISTDMIMTPTGSSIDGEIEDYMLKLVGFDYGDLPDSYNTSGGDSPPAHVITADLKLGASVDSETDGQPDTMAGMMGGGDDGSIGETTLGTPSPTGDDEDGIMLTGFLIPGATAAVMVDVMNMTGEPAILQGWMDFNGNGTFDSGEELTTGSFSPVGAVIPDGGLDGAKLTFDIPAGATFSTGGNVMARFRLSPDGGLEPDSQTGTPPRGEIEDYKFAMAKVGNLVWEDYNNNGLQDAGEPGIDGVTVTLVYAGLDGDINTTSDNESQTVTTGSAGGFDSGEFYFCNMAAGSYKVIYTTPQDMIPTSVDKGSQIYGGLSDNDAKPAGMNLSMIMEFFTISDPSNLVTGENGTGDNGLAPTGGYPDSQTDETHDAGFWRPCCSDLLQHCCPVAPNRK